MVLVWMEWYCTSRYSYTYFQQKINTVYTNTLYIELAYYFLHYVCVSSAYSIIYPYLHHSCGSS